MFCRKCGKEITEDSKFCPECGTAVEVVVSDVSDRTSTQSDVEPLLVLRPVFIPWVTAAFVIPLAIFFGIWGGGFFGGFSWFGLKALGYNAGPYTFIFFGLLFLLGIPFLAYAAKKRTYDKTEYRFYNNRLEYAEGFWTVENKTIKYNRIAEVYLRRGVIQKKYALGTLYLATPATGMPSGTSGSGIRIRDIQDPESIYEQVQKLVG